MKRWQTLIRILLIGHILALLTVGAAARWEGPHRFSLTLQGTQTTIDYVTGQTTSVPLELRTVLRATVGAPDKDGNQTGRLHFIQVQANASSALADLTTAAGYGFVLNANQSPRLLDPIPGLQEAKIDPVALLASLFPWHVSEPLTVADSKTRSYTEKLILGETAIDLLTTNTMQVYELRPQAAVLQATIRGSVSHSLQPGRLTVEQLGSGISHIDPATGNLLRSATTVRTTVTTIVPAQAGVPATDRELRTLLTVSVERVADDPPAAVVELGELYVDPAGRFQLALPKSWPGTPVYMDHTSTVFENTETNERLFVDIIPAAANEEATAYVQNLLTTYARFLIDFTIGTTPTAIVAADRAATYSEYSYRDDVVLTEALLHIPWTGHHVLLQYAAPAEQFAQAGTQLLTAIAAKFSLGPAPEGYISADALLHAPVTLYESSALGFEIEMPMVWPPIETDDGSVQFAEIGSSGRLSIHTEEGSVDDDPLALLTSWLQRLSQETGSIHLIQQATATTAGGLPAAHATFRWEAGNQAMTQQLLIANNNGVLYVLALYYDTAGYEARRPVFQRMLTGFVPLADEARRHARTYDPYSAPPNPAGPDAHLVLGRLLHDMTLENEPVTRPAANVRLDLVVDNERFSAFTDDDGFFYVANVMAPSGQPISVEAIRGPLFGFASDVHIPVEGLVTDTLGRIHLLGQLTLSLDASQTTVNVRLDSGVDRQTGVSTIHQFFLNRFPNSLWSDAVRDDLARRQQAGN